jgi:hypothetical protein
MLEAMAARAALDQEPVLRESFPEEAVVVGDAGSRMLQRRLSFAPVEASRLE